MDTEDPPLYIPDIPTRPSAPLSTLGFLKALRTNALTAWPEAAYREPVTHRKFGGRNSFTFADPEAVHRILVANPGNYRRSAASVRILGPVAGNGLLLAEGDNWKLQRRTVAPALAPRTMPLLARYIVASTQDSIAALKELDGDGIDMRLALQTLTLNIAGGSMFSLEMADQGDQLRHLLVEFGERHARPKFLDMYLPPSIPSPGDFARKRFKRRWMGIMDRLIHDRLGAEPPESSRDLFDLLRAARDPETGTGFDAETLRDQVATLLLAGHETTALTLFWATMLLARAPDVQRRAAAEAAGVRIDPDNAMQALGSLPYVKAVVNETLRLFPPAYLIVREAIGPDQVGSATVARRDIVMVPPWTIHRHHMFWQNPDAFDPSRFLPDAPPPPRFAFLPFGGGPRICVGAQFALAEAVLVLASLLQAFEISLPDTRPILPVGIVTTQPDRAPLFDLKLRR